MIPYRTARCICTYKCNRKCPGCVNSIHPRNSIAIIGDAQWECYDEIILTGGEPLLFMTQLIDLIDRIKHNRVILYTNAPSYAQLFALSQMIAGVTITLHNNSDAERFNDNFYKFFGGNHGADGLLFFVRIYEAVSIRVTRYPNVQYKMCKWVEPEQCKLGPNETLYRLQNLWE